jgi:hypothetical protein
MRHAATGWRWALIGGLGFGVLAATPASVPAQNRITVSGVVTDTSGAPVPNASLIVARRGRWISDADGNFRIGGMVGTMEIEVRRIGLMPTRVTLTAARDTTITVVMHPVAVTLGETRVMAARTDALTRNGFYDRMRDRELGLNNGSFLTPEDIEERRANRTTQYIEGLPGIRVAQTQHGGIPATSANCALTIYLDGMRLQTAGTRMSTGSNAPRIASGGSNSSTGRDALVDHIVGASTVAAIEVYPRAVGAPPQYLLLNGTCGVMLIWTK